MKGLIPILIFALSLAVADSQGAVESWVQRYDGPGNGDDGAVAIAVDTKGNVVVTGYSITTNGYPDYAYATIKYSPAGEALWTNRYGGPGNSFDRAVALALSDLGNVFVTGVSYGMESGPDYATVAYSSSGVPLWTNRFGEPGVMNNDEASALVDDGEDDVIVTGYSTGAGASADYTTIKYSGAGTPLWTNRYDGPASGDDKANAIAVDSHGNVFVTGFSIGTNGHPEYATVMYSTGGTPMWTNRYSNLNYADIAKAIALGISGNVFVTGSSYGTGANADFATVAYTTGGDPLWTNRYAGSGSGDDSATAIAVDDQGAVFVTGYAPTLGGAPPHFATVAYSETGTSLWTNLYTGGVGDDEPAAIQVDHHGGVIVTGYSIGAGTGADYATISYSSDGLPLWTNRYNGPSNNPDYSIAIAVGAGGDLFVTGYSYGVNDYPDFATIKYSMVRPIPLLVEVNVDSLVLSWTNAVFSLQSSPKSTGTFTNIPGSTSPYTNPITGAQQFFRLISN